MNTLGICIGLNFLETFLFYYLLFGTVIDRKTLQEAQKHPEDYRDLIVRVAGYSDFFRNLSKPLQDEIINRTEQSFELDKQK